MNNLNPASFIVGPEAPMTMLFEPHLPEYSCTLRAKMGGGALQQA